MSSFQSTGRTVAATLLVAAFLATNAVPSLAAVAIVNVQVAPRPGGGALVTVQFGGPSPRWRVLGAGTSEVAVVFQDVTLGPTIAPTIAGQPPLTSVSVLQSGASASVSLHLAQAVPVQVRIGGPTTLLLEVIANGTHSVVNTGRSSTPAPQAEGTITEVVPLKYADISEVAGILVPNSNVASNDNFQPQSTALGSSSLGSSFGGAFGGSGFQPQQPVQSFGGAFGQQQGMAQRLNDNIAVDRRLNAIILTGTPAQIADFKVIIDKIDIPVDSVILETQIVELNDTALRDIGVDFAASGGDLVAGTQYTIKNLQTGQGQVGLAANLYAVVNEGHGRVIAKPRILAQSGQSASILTGDAIPIITQVVIASGSSVTSQQVNYVNVGVNLQILPRVSSDGYVTSHIYSEVSSVTGFTQGVPQISQRQALTTATVKDGEPFIIGGLLQDNEIRNLTRLPFIGDLPLIGAFFRHTNTSHSQTNLYLVVTPHIVHRAAGSPPTQAQPLINATPIPVPFTSPSPPAR